MKSIVFYCLIFIVVAVSGCIFDEKDKRNDNNKNTAHSLSGRIIDSDGSGINGVAVRLTGENRELTTETDASGLYLFTDLDSGSYIVEPTNGLYTFTPLNREVTITNSSAENTDFQNAASSNPVVVMTTSMGTIEITLYQEQAPVTVENFLNYVTSGFFDGTIFHRVIPSFVIQGGGLTADMNEKRTNAPIGNEANNGLKNLRGTLSMARTSDINSATSQFFINLVDNISLDHRNETMDGFGYAVFAAVTSGMDVVDAIAGVPTTTKGWNEDVPIEPVVIESVTVK